MYCPLAILIRMVVRVAERCRALLISDLICQARLL
jgi:hypothetical protein